MPARAASSASSAPSASAPSALGALPCCRRPPARPRRLQSVRVCCAAGAPRGRQQGAELGRNARRGVGHLSHALASCMQLCLRSGSGSGHLSPVPASCMAAGLRAAVTLHGCSCGAAPLSGAAAMPLPPPPHTCGRGRGRSSVVAGAAARRVH
eukprot:347246-Chlamydomonas_euryale.AAC.1